MAYYDSLLVGQPTALGARLNRWMMDAFFQRVQGALPLGGRVVEIGPGRGELAERCLRSGIRYTAVDANPGACDIVRQLGGDAVQALVPPIPLEEASADLVCAISVIEHMPTHLEALSLVTEMARVTAPGGRILIHTPDILSCGVHFWNSEYTHSFPTSRRRLYQLCLDAGLRVVKAEHVAGPFSGLAGAIVASGMRMFPHNLAAALCLGAVSAEQWYKTRTALMRSVLVVAEKESRRPSR